MSLTVNSGTPRYTLRCATIGGPVGRVQWLAGDHTLIGNKELMNRITGEYTLTVNINTIPERVSCAINSPSTASVRVFFDGKRTYINQ